MMRRLIYAAVLALGLMVGGSSAMAEPSPEHTMTIDTLPVAEEPVAVAARARSPVDYGRDYGRLLILLAVPAAFIGLHLHLSRRLQILPPKA